MSKRRLLITTCLSGILVCFVALSAFANPQGGTVANGQATIAQSGNKLTVTQSTEKAVINWSGFDIAPSEITQFIQPDSSALTLNRVNSNSASQIFGQLIANGNIIIVNQNGVLFGAGSQVNVNSLIATTADIENNAFMNSTGPLAFSKPKWRLVWRGFPGQRQQPDRYDG